MCEGAMKGVVVLLLVLGLMAPGGARADDALDAFVQDSRAKVKAFAGQLKGALQAAIKEGGPGHAIPVCNTEAPEIARRLSEAPGWTVGRTSHRLRNPANAPDAWEAAVLDSFLERAAAGEALATMERAERIQSGGRDTYRYMKAIPAGEVCLTCHGAAIDPALAAKIAAYYPEDRATGFALGELRGAFTITKTVED